MMSALQELPARSVSLSQTGVDRLIQRLHGQPGNLEVAISALASNPRQAIEHLFRLSRRQHTELSRLSNEHLGEVLGPLVQAANQPGFAGQRVILEAPGGPVPAYRVRVE